jgi:hypothetical protein
VRHSYEPAVPSERLTPGGAVLVSLIKAPRPGMSYPARVRSDDGNRVVLTAPWAGPPVRDMGFVRFEQGDLFTEHFWRDRWYAIKEIVAADGRLKGWYCDVTRPIVVRDGVLEVVDLDLDLWRSADGQVLRLDEDEFAASGLAERDPAAARQAVAAIEELERLAADAFATVLK